MMRHAYIPNVPQYQMQATSAPFQPAQFIPQQAQYFNQGVPQAMFYVPPNQQIQQPQQPQQPTQTQNTAIQTNNINKSKPKRSSKIVIRDPKDNKDVTEEILHSSTANGRTGSTPPLTNSTVQTDSSKIQAQFAAQVAARVGGEKGKQIGEKKAEDTGKHKDGQASTAQIDETKTEANIQGNGSAVTDESCAKDLPQNNTEISNKVTSIAEENRTGSPKGTTDNTHANQSSPTLGEITQKMKMTIESQKGTRNEVPKVVLKRADRETTTKSEGSETTTKSEGSETTTKSEGSETKEVADVSVPMSQNNENTGERKTSKVVVHSPVEQTKNEDKGDSLDNGQNGINVSKTPESNETLSEMTSDKTKKIVETITDTEGDAKEDLGKETGSKQEDIAQIQEEIVKPNESHGELLSQPEVTKQETTEQQAEEVAEQEQNKLSQVDKQPELIQTDKELQIRQAEKEQEVEETKQQEQQIDKQQQQHSDKQEEKQSDKQQHQSDKQQHQSDKQQEKQSDKQQQQSDKQQEKQSDKQQQQSDKQQQQSDKQQEKPSDKQQQQSDKQQQQQQTRQPDKKQDNPKPQQQEKQQSQKTGEKYKLMICIALHFMEHKPFLFCVKSYM